MTACKQRKRMNSGVNFQKYGDVWCKLLNYMYSPFGQSENRVNNYLKIRDNSMKCFKSMKNNNNVIHIRAEFPPNIKIQIKKLSIWCNVKI